MMRGNLKNGKKQFVLDENRRNTYFQLHPSIGGREPSVLTTFDGEKKQLMPVSLYLTFVVYVRWFFKEKIESHN